MIYTLIGLYLSAIFGVLVLIVLGPEALISQLWIDQVLFALLGAGIVLNIIDNIWSVRLVVCGVAQKIDQLLVNWFHTSHHCVLTFCDCNDQYKGTA